MDIPNIKNVKIGLQTLRLLNTPMSKIHLVLNRANSKVKLDVSEVERTLQVKAEALVPSDIVVPQSVNKGTPVVLDAPPARRSPRALEQLADRFVPAAEKGRRKKSRAPARSSPSDAAHASVRGTGRVSAGPDHRSTMRARRPVHNRTQASR